MIESGGLSATPDVPLSSGSALRSGNLPEIRAIDHRIDLDLRKVLFRSSNAESDRKGPLAGTIND